MEPQEMKIVAISDTHCSLHQVVVPDGDVLIHAGDFSMRGSYAEIMSEIRLFAKLPHRHKVMIAGNHDFEFQFKLTSLRDRCADLGITYLQDSGCVIEGVSFYGSPWQPEFFNWAFNLRRGEELREKWEMIPTGVDVLITHGPPTGYGSMNDRGDETGDDDLLAEIVNRVIPKVHIYGHIHEGYGDRIHPILPIRFINASTCNSDYEPINKPITLVV